MRRRRSRARRRRTRREWNHQSGCPLPAFGARATERKPSPRRRPERTQTRPARSTVTRSGADGEVAPRILVSALRSNSLASTPPRRQRVLGAINFGRHRLATGHALPIPLVTQLRHALVRHGQIAEFVPEFLGHGPENLPARDRRSISRRDAGARGPPPLSFLTATGADAVALGGDEPSGLGFTTTVTLLHQNRRR